MFWRKALFESNKLKEKNKKEGLNLLRQIAFAPKTLFLLLWS